LEFQEYFVGRKQTDDVTGVVFAGVDDARITNDVANVIATADVIVFCPSNPIVSIGPILAMPGMRESLSRSSAPIVAVSPIVGGKALKGPADKMLTTLGHEVSAVGVAAIYAGVIDALVIDETDHLLAPRIVDLGMEVLVTETVMGGPADRQRLAMEILAFAGRVKSRTAPWPQEVAT